MAHYAKLGIGNKVLTVEVVHNDTATSEQAGVDFLNNFYKTNDIWKKTSYNMFGGVHKLGGTPFRKNFASIGFKYDEARDAFIEPKPHTSWILNETSCLFEAPITHASDGKYYTWNETLYQSDNTKGWETED